MPSEKKCRQRKKPLALHSHRRLREGNRAALPFFHVGRDRAWIVVERGRAKLTVERGTGRVAAERGRCRAPFLSRRRGSANDVALHGLNSKIEI
jgi:hypothetical protein